MEILAGGFMTMALGWMAWVSREIINLREVVQEHVITKKRRKRV